MGALLLLVDSLAPCAHPHLWSLSSRPSLGCPSSGGAGGHSESAFPRILAVTLPWTVFSSLCSRQKKEDRANWTRPAPTLMCRTQPKAGAKGPEAVGQWSLVELEEQTPKKWAGWAGRPLGGSEDEVGCSVAPCTHRTQHTRKRLHGGGLG